eukprot:scaffold246801_cov27-Tisochrysis_lutea.AAC.2
MSCTCSCAFLVAAAIARCVSSGSAAICGLRGAGDAASPPATPAFLAISSMRRCTSTPASAAPLALPSCACRARAALAAAAIMSSAAAPLGPPLAPLGPAPPATAASSSSSEEGSSSPSMPAAARSLARAARFLRSSRAIDSASNAMPRPDLKPDVR